MRRLTKITMAILALACSVACSKQEPEHITVEKEVVIQPVASYSFDGASYTVHTVTCILEEDYLEVIVAREPEGPYTSYIYFGILADNIGRKLDFSDLAVTKWLDYFLTFEDPNHYYSADYALKGGTLLVEKDSAGDYKVTLDVKLYDGKSLKFSCSGIKLSKSE